MDFTRPFQQNETGRILSGSELLRALRLDLATELDAMSLYQAHIEAISDPHVQAVLARIRDDEKEHAAQLVKVIATMDATQEGKLQQANLDFDSPDRPLIRYASITERVLELDRRIEDFAERMT